METPANRPVPKPGQFKPAFAGVGKVSKAAKETSEEIRNLTAAMQAAEEAEKATPKPKICTCGHAESEHLSGMLAKPCAEKSCMCMGFKKRPYVPKEHLTERPFATALADLRASMPEPKKQPVRRNPNKNNSK